MNRFSDIRTFEGTQARAWEELCYQLRSTPGPGHVETRKTKAPDGGVEWYEVYSDAHEEGFQAKFHRNLEDALSGMRESVKTVAALRPSMTRLTFIVPYDFSDTPGTRKSDQDRWQDAVAGWRRDIPRADQITFAVKRGGDVLAEVTRAEHVGRRMFWFGELELSDQWFANRWDETRAAVGERYTPEAHTWSEIENDINATVLDSAFAQAVMAQATRAVNACETNEEAWSAGDSVAIRAALDELKQWMERTFGRAPDAAGYEDVRRQPDIDLQSPRVSIAVLLTQLEKVARQDEDGHRSYSIRSAQQAVATLERTLAGRAAELCSMGALAIAGEAGQGKTHALVHTGRQLLDAGVPAIVVPAHRFRAGAWWPQMAGILGGIEATSDQFLAALDSLGEARGRRAVLIIDALNESEAPTGWQEELAALHAQISRYPWICLIVSFRRDYARVIAPPAGMRVVRHPGLAGWEAEALKRYCALYKIPVPTASMADPAFGNPLFLRIYCEVSATNGGVGSDGITRSSLFDRFSQARGEKVLARLAISPTSLVVRDAINLMADHLIASGGRPVSRDQVEPLIDGLLKDRNMWPQTLFGSLMSEGLIEILPPGSDGVETVGLPFQAYSEHVVVNRLLDAIGARHAAMPIRSGLLWRRRRPELLAMVATELARSPRFWRAAAVAVPERYGSELIDLLPAYADNYRMIDVTHESLSGRRGGAFTARSFEILEATLGGNDAESAVDIILALAPRLNHPANARWLHRRLCALAMPDRDATWGIASYDADESQALRHVASWSEDDNSHASNEEVVLMAIPLMWFLASPNRFLRDEVTKILVQIFGRRLTTLADVLRLASEVDDVYVQERMITVAYGAVMIGGDADLGGVGAVAAALVEWHRQSLPINVLARDSARGVLAWAHDRGVIDAAVLARFAPPYGAEPPADPPSAAYLEAAFGRDRGPSGKSTEWRAHSILRSCLDWMGDFHKYVIAGDVNVFSQHRLSGPPPASSRTGDRHGEIDAPWAGRWVAHRAISIGWTPERFAVFEGSRDLSRGRDAHKAERFGKKYQWIAHHELMARIADNFHLARPWQGDPTTYQGPWPWFGRDIDPSLPPSTTRDGTRICLVDASTTDSWIIPPEPDLDSRVAALTWVSGTDDLPDTIATICPTDHAGKTWVALYRYSSWHRDSSVGLRLSPRERDLFLLQFSWLAPRGTGRAIFDLLAERRLRGRWMPEFHKNRRQYLGEGGWAPITTTPRERDEPKELSTLGLEVTPATEEYIWEGSTLDCSIDESVNFHTPTPELAGPARWTGGRADWADSGQVVCRAVTTVDTAGRDHTALIADETWLERRLDDLSMELVIGTLGEKHAAVDDGSLDPPMAWCDITYLGLIVPGEPVLHTGPLLTVQRSG